ncbi:polysaccharide deacetylase family protein [Ruegeria sp. 1NDH52C]|uniref:Polysaccharide deacetylase family protein n=1 Tax=Ruegeria alba TaxID=2916756 RepID=A0ABS9NT10_9RHOB|nr:polysaccharide deacetylase family protein [Ruegeria alba]MCG6557358.1 polysaccharide deacetylase family protein [Ruegeria alba]
MTPDWTPLDAELALWAAEGLTLPLWWRDDDAVTTTPQLDQLTALAEDLDLPVHLAVIPAGAETALADHVAAHPHLVPVVHGWAHQNHAPATEKKAEFRAHRPLPEILAEAGQGKARLQALFGAALRPMFVPPWNRITPEVASGLPALGFRALSTATPRRNPMAAPGLAQVNTHLDPIDWRGSRGLMSPQNLIAQTATLLADRREGRADATEPFGILTHHLVHDDEIWQFTRALLTRLLAGPSQPWTMPPEEIQQ